VLLAFTVIKVKHLKMLQQMYAHIVATKYPTTMCLLCYTITAFFSSWAVHTNVHISIRSKGISSCKAVSVHLVCMYAYEKRCYIKHYRAEYILLLLIYSLMMAPWCQNM